MKSYVVAAVGPGKLRIKVRKVGVENFRCCGEATDSASQWLPPMRGDQIWVVGLMLENSRKVRNL